MKTFIISGIWHYSKRKSVKVINSFSRKVMLVPQFMDNPIASCMEKTRILSNLLVI